MKDDKKNYSFYMPVDFDDKIESLRQNIQEIKGLSKSQALYFLISKLASGKMELDLSEDNK